MQTLYISNIECFYMWSGEASLFASGNVVGVCLTFYFQLCFPMIYQLNMYRYLFTFLLAVLPIYTHG